MRIENSHKINVDINKLLTTFSSKYATLISFLPPTEIELMFQKAIAKLSTVEDINPDFYINFEVEKMFFLKARDEIKNGNIDLEILIVDKYLTTAQFILRRLKYQSDDASKMAEESIMECIENYEGQYTFKNALVKTIKKLINPPKQEVGVIEPQEVALPTETKKVVQDKARTMEAEAELEPLVNAETIKETKEAKEIELPNDNIIRNPNQLELMVRTFDILHQVALEDETYLKFLSLKYGYYNNQYFDLAEIAHILSISLEKSKQYYLQSLDYVKNWFGLQLDKMYTYYLQN